MYIDGGWATFTRHARNRTQSMSALTVGGIFSRKRLCVGNGRLLPQRPLLTLGHSVSSGSCAGSQPPWSRKTMLMVSTIPSRPAPAAAFFDRRLRSVVRITRGILKSKTGGSSHVTMKASLFSESFAQADDQLATYTLHERVRCAYAPT